MLAREVVQSKSSAFSRSEKVAVGLIASFVILYLLPKPDQCYVIVANALNSIGLSSPAERLYNRATEINIYCGEAWVNLCFLQAARGNRIGAENSCNAAMEAQPKDIETFCRLVMLRESLQANLGKSLLAYKQALHADPQDAQAWFKIGTQLGLSGDLKGSELAFRRVTKLNPESAEAWLSLGNATFNPNEAIASYRKALSLKPDLSEAWFALGKTLTGMDNAYAERALLQAIALTPGYADAWHELGCVRRCLGKNSESAEAFEQAQQLGWTQAP